jgi:hypothetical protein
MPSRIGATTGGKNAGGLTYDGKLAQNAEVVMTRPAFSVVISQHWLAMRGELCSETIT